MRHALLVLIALASVGSGGCNGVSVNSSLESAEPESGDTVTVFVASLDDLWFADLPLAAVRRADRQGVFGYEVWFEVEGAYHALWWPRSAIDFGPDAPEHLDHADRWRAFRGKRVNYPGALTAESAPRVHEAILWIERKYRGQAEGAITAMEAFGVVSVLGSLVPAGAVATGSAAGRGAGSGVGRGAGSSGALPPGGSVWSLGWGARGQRIEQALGRNLPNNYPVLDRFVKATGVATSIKSIDLASRSYQRGARVYSRLKMYIDKLASFKGRQWAGADIRQGYIRHRVIELAIPSAGTPVQQQAIRRAIAYARSVGVELKIVVFP